MSLALTQLLDAVVSARGKYFSNFENRLSEYGALRAFMDGSDMLLPKSMIENARQSPVHPVKIPVLNKAAVELITARACEITGNDSTSVFKALSWITRGFEIKVTEVVNVGNYISMEDDFAQQFAMGLKKVFETLDLLSVSNLETNKSAVLADSGLADEVAGAYVIPYADYVANEMYMHIPALMRANDLNGPYYDIANTDEISKMLKYRTLGGNNQQNIAGLFGQLDASGVYKNFITNRLTPSADEKAVHFVIPEGSIGLYTWNDWEARNNRQLNDADKKYLMQDPIMGITWDVHEKRTCVNREGWGSVYTTLYQFNADFAFMSAYSSDTTSPIIKVTAPKPAI